LKIATSLARRISNDNIIHGIWFAVWPRRSEEKVFSVALIQVGVVPWVEPNNANQILRAEMVYKHWVFVRNNEGSSVMSKGFEGVSNGI
jgi:hypothetical protein